MISKQKNLNLHQINQVVIHIKMMFQQIVLIFPHKKLISKHIKILINKHLINLINKSLNIYQNHRNLINKYKIKSLNHNHRIFQNLKQMWKQMNIILQTTYLVFLQINIIFLHMNLITYLITKQITFQINKNLFKLVKK